MLTLTNIVLLLLILVLLAYLILLFKPLIIYFYSNCFGKFGWYGITYLTKLCNGGFPFRTI